MILNIAQLLYFHLQKIYTLLSNISSQFSPYFPDTPIIYFFKESPQFHTSAIPILIFIKKTSRQKAEGLICSADSQGLNPFLSLSRGGAAR